MLDPLTVQDYCTYITEGLFSVTTKDGGGGKNTIMVLSNPLSYNYVFTLLLPSAGIRIKLIPALMYKLINI